MQKRTSFLVLFLILWGIGNINAQSFSELQKITNSSGTTNDRFGTSVSIHDSYAIVGDPVDNSASIYEYSSGTWSKVQTFTGSGKFGFAVAIYGDYAVVGAYQASTYGKAYLYKRASGGGWSQVKEYSGNSTNYTFGYSVAIDNSLMAVGVPNAKNTSNQNVGAVYLMKKDEGGTDNWGVYGIRSASDDNTNDQFGISVDVDGNMIIVGAQGDDGAGTDRGAAYIFFVNYTNQRAKLTCSSGSYRAGESVSLNGDYAVIGSPDYSSGRGAVYVFKKPGTNWSDMTTETQKITKPSPHTHDYFGQGVSIEDDLLLIGAKDYAHTAYIYKNNSGTWGLNQTMQASDNNSSSNFGNAVSLSGSNLIIGAYTDASKGAAYIFAQAPEITVTPSSLAFGDVGVGQSSTKTYHLQGSNLTQGITIDPPTGYQVSYDGTHWSNHWTFTPSNGSINKTVYVKFEPTASTTYNGNISNSSTGATTKYVAVTGTGVSTDPVITTSPSSLAFGDVNVGQSSTKQYTLTGENLTNDVIVTTVSDFKVSLTSGSGFASQITVAQSGGNINKIIYVKFSPTSANSMGVNIANTNPEAANKYVAVTGTGVVPTLSVSPSSLAFGNVYVGASDTKQYTLTGENLTANATVTAPTGYQVSLTSGSGFASSISVTQTGGSINKTIYVKFSPTASTNYNGNISNTSTDATTKNVAVTGAGIEASLSSSVSELDFGDIMYGETSQEKTFTITGSNLNDDVILLDGTILSDYGFEISKTSGSGFGTSMTIAPDANGNVNQTVYVRCTANRTGQSTSDPEFETGTPSNHNYATITIDFKYNGRTEVTTNPTSIDFGNVSVGTESITSYNVHCEHLDGRQGAKSVYIHSPSGDYTISRTETGTYSSVLVYSGFGATFDETIWIKFSPASAGVQSGNATHNVYYADNYELPVTGTGVVPTLSVSPTSLDFGNVVVGQSSEMSYTLTGSNLINDVHISAPNGYQVSLTSGSSFASTLDVTPSSGSVNQTIYVKFSPVAETTYSGNIKNSSTNTGTKNVAVTGTGVVSTLTASETKIDFGNQVAGIQSGEMSFTLTGSYLTEDVDLYGGALVTNGFEISTTSGSGFSTSLSISPDANGDVNETIYVRCTPNHVYFATVDLEIQSGSGNGSAYTSVELDYSATSVINLSETSLDFGNVLVGNSSTLSYTVSGDYFYQGESNTDYPITVTAPAGDFQVCLTEAGTYGSSVEIMPVDGSFNQTVWVKFSPTSTGIQTGNVANSNDYADTKNVAVTGTGVVPTLSVSPASLNFGNVVTGQSSEMSYDLTGEYLTANATITAPAGYEVSLTSGSGFASSVNVTQSGGDISQTIYVKFSPTAETAYNGNITNESTDANTVNVAVFGTGVAPATPIITTSLSSIDFGNIQTGSNDVQTYTVEGTDLTEDITISVTGSNYEISDDGTTYGTSNIVLAQTAGTVNSTTIYVKFSPDADGHFDGTIIHTSGAASQTNITLDGDGVTPTMTATPTSLNFGNVITGQSSEMSYDLTGEYLTANATITAPSGYEVSLTSGSGFASSVDVTQTTGNISQTIYVKFSPTAETVYNGNITNESTDANTVNVAVSGTGVAPATPIITTSLSSIDFGNIQTGSNDVQTYTVEGTDLTEDITISVTGSNYEISEDGTTFGTDNIVLAKTAAGTVNSTTIYVKFSPDAVQTYTGTVSCSSSGANQVDISLEGSGVEPTLTVSTENLSFGDVEIGTSTELSYNLSGMYLTDDVIITPPTGFMVSTQSGISFENSLTITPAAGSINMPIYVQFSPTTEMNYNGSISNESTGATTQTVDVTGTGVAIGTPVITSSITDLDFGEEEVGQEQTLTYMISGSNLTDDINISLETGSQFTISNDNTSFGTSLTLVQTGGTVAETTVYVKFSPTAVQTYTETISCTSTGASQVDISLTGEGIENLNPVISSSVNSLNFNDVEIGSSSEMSYTLTGSDLLGDVTVTAPTGFEVSQTSESGFASTLTITPNNGSINQSIFVKFDPTAETTYTGTITNVSQDAITQNIAVIGNGVQAGSPTIYSTLSSIVFNDVEIGTEQILTYDISGSNLTEDIVISLESGNVFEISEDGTTFGTTDIILSQTDGSVENTTIYVKFSPTAVQTYTETISCTSTGASQVDISLTGEGIENLNPVISSSVNSLNFNDVEIGSSSEMSYTLTGSDLLGDVTVTAPTGFEVSQTSGSGFASTLTITPNNGSINQSIFVKFDPTAETTYTGTITNESQDAITQNVTVSGNGVQAGTPTIYSTLSSIVFNDVEIGTEQILTYDISGSNLTEDIVISLESGNVFEISEDNVNFGTTLTLSPTDGNVELTTIYVKFAPNGKSDFTDTIYHESLGATTNEIELTGNSVAANPELENVEITIFPNPTLDFINVEVNNAEVQNIDIIDLSGKVLERTNSKTVDFSNYASGIYFVKIQIDNEIILKKVVKQ